LEERLIVWTRNWKDENLLNRTNRGKAVIMGIFLLALVLSGYAWWHQYQQSWRCREFFGSETVQLVRLAKRVELLRLESSSPADASEPNSPKGILRIGNSTVLIVRQTDISTVPGLLHARHALLQDLNYDWDAPPSQCVSQWSFALRFEQEGNDTIIAFDPECNRIGLDGADGTGPFNSELMQTYVEKSVEWETRAADASGASSGRANGGANSNGPAGSNGAAGAGVAPSEATSAP